jgi:cytochrome c oxidase subunit IV
VTVGLRLFLSSAAFGVTIALAYWFTSREIVGTFMLGVMAFGLSFVAGYTIVAEREADLIGDEKNATIQSGAGELVGTYTVTSPLPLGSALAVTFVGLGIVVSPVITVLGILAVLVFGALLVIQSR